MNDTATLDLAAELNQQIALIAGDEEKMRAAINSLKRIVHRKPKTYSKTAEEVYADIAEALEETRRQINGEIPFHPISELFDDL